MFLWGVTGMRSSERIWAKLFKTYSLLFLVFLIAAFPRLSELAKPAKSSLFRMLFKSRSP